MRQKTQTDKARPTLCHAEAERPAPRSGAHNFLGRGGSKDVGAAFEAHALAFLQRQRLRFVARNVACRGGEIDLVMRERDGSQWCSSKSGRGRVGTMAARRPALGGRNVSGWCVPRGIIWPRA